MLAQPSARRHVPGQRQQQHQQRVRVVEAEHEHGDLGQRDDRTGEQVGRGTTCWLASASLVERHGWLGASGAARATQPWRLLDSRPSGRRTPRQHAHRGHAGQRLGHQGSTTGQAEQAHREPISHSDAGVLSTVMELLMSDEPKNNAFQLSDPPAPRPERTSSPSPTRRAPQVQHGGGQQGGQGRAPGRLVMAARSTGPAMVAAVPVGMRGRGVEDGDRRGRGHVDERVRAPSAIP